GGRGGRNGDGARDREETVSEPRPVERAALPEGRDEAHEALGRKREAPRVVADEAARLRRREALRERDEAGPLREREEEDLRERETAGDERDAARDGAR